MERITFEDYKKGVLKKFGEMRIQDLTGMLLHPTPAQLRNHCMLKIDSLTNSDVKLFREFFEVAEGTDLRTGVGRFETGRLKSLISFLNNESTTASNLRVEIAAIIADFSPRPYSRYLTVDRTPTHDPNWAEGKADLDQPSAETEDQGQFLSPMGVKLASAPNIIRPTNKIVFVLAALLVLVVIGYVIKRNFTAGNCLQWRDDHFEQVDCEGQRQVLCL